MLIVSFVTQNNFSKTLSNQSVNINIEPLKNTIIKGEFWDVLVTIRNNSNDTITIPSVNQHLIVEQESSTINYYHPQSGDGYTVIPPKEEYIFILDPIKFINYKKEDKKLVPGLPWFYWPEGDYEYYISQEVGDKVFYSNKIPITVLPVPDSLKKAFEDLKDDISKPMNLSDYENFYEKYKGTYYEKEFGYKLLFTNKYVFGLSKAGEDKELFNKVQKNYKEFILKYPDTEIASLIFSYIYGNKEKGSGQLLKEVLDSLKKRNDAGIFNKVLQNQQKYYMKDIDKY